MVTGTSVTAPQHCQHRVKGEHEHFHPLNVILKMIPATLTSTVCKCALRRLVITCRIFKAIQKIPSSNLLEVDIRILVVSVGCVHHPSGDQRNAALCGWSLIISVYNSR